MKHRSSLWLQSFLNRNSSEGDLRCDRTLWLEDLLATCDSQVVNKNTRRGIRARILVGFTGDSPLERDRTCGTTAVKSFQSEH